MQLIVFRDLHFNSFDFDSPRFSGIVQSGLNENVHENIRHEHFDENDTEQSFQGTKRSMENCECYDYNEHI
jgi:hypothetical protein